MAKSMRRSTLETLGLGTVLDLVRTGRPPAGAGELVEEVFGEKASRGSLVVTGGNGIVGAGKVAQLGSRLEPFGVQTVALDFPNAPDGIGRQYRGLVRTFGKDRADRIMASVVRLSYDGKTLPSELGRLRPRFLLEAIPEILEVKRSHYELFRETFPGIEIRSVTSGFPSSELGVGIAHPAFPHEVNKVWEIVEPAPSAITKLFWSLGLIPIPVGDQWSFVLDVLFSGLTLAGTRVHQATNMPFWKLDKYIRRLLGPNPFRAHDAIGAKGANFLTWSCMSHLAKKYGAPFRPTSVLEAHQDLGADWYPPNHFRPVIDWTLERAEREEFEAWILGSLFQMTALMLHEERSHLAQMNAIGELCAQFRRGILAVIRSHGAAGAIERVKAYHALHPEAAREAWYPAAFERIETPEWQQLYVNAEHDGKIGVLTIGRESYNADVDAELNRAIGWLKFQNIDSVVLTGDFHLSTQMVGADTSEFFPALDEESEGVRIAGGWSRTARRLNDEFGTSVGLVAGKRCLGGFLELLTHCHYVVAVSGASLAFPEVTLPVVPGMEACHWPWRKANKQDWPKLLSLLLGGQPVRAEDAVGWLVDYAGPLPEALQVVSKILTHGDHGLLRRKIETGALDGVPSDLPGLADSGDPATEAARKAIVATVQAACAVPLDEAVDLQARHSAAFMKTEHCRKGRVGSERARTMNV